MTHRRALARLADLYLALADKPAPTDDERLVRAAIQAALIFAGAGTLVAYASQSGARWVSAEGGR